MKFISIISLFTAVIIGSCFQQSTEGKNQIKQSPNQYQNLKNGIRIDNGTNRGINYTDSSGTDFNIRYIPIKITNDTIIPINFQITFSKEYDYPQPNSHEKFRLIPMPKEWALDGNEITESMLNELPAIIKKPTFSVNIEPSQELVMGIGAVYPRPPKTTGVLPNKLFTKGKSKKFPMCNWLIKSDSLSNANGVLNLKLNFGEHCTVIDCGQITYLDR